MARKSRKHNTNSTIAITRATRRAEMRAFDNLPPSIRAILREAAVPWSAVNLVTVLHQLCLNCSMAFAISETENRLAIGEQAERESFDQYHQTRYGYRLPHEAAQASILRYDRHKS